MLRTNYRCGQSPNIIVDVAKCVVNFHKINSKSALNFVCYKKLLVLTEQSFNGKLSIH